VNLNIELPDDIAAALKAQAEAQGISATNLASQVIGKAIKPTVGQKTTVIPLETGYGMWAKYGPAPSAEEIDENRREMFR
jgi:hypothetical protein